MQEIIEDKIVDGVFNGPMYACELVYQDIKLDLTFKNNLCHIHAFSRGHHVRQHPLHRTLHAPAREGSPASQAGDGAMFLSLVVQHCYRMNPMVIWAVDFLTEWWSEVGICSFFSAHCSKGADGNIYIDSAHFLSWANYTMQKYIQEKTGGKRTIKSRKRKGRKRKKVKSVKKR